MPTSCLSPDRRRQISALVSSGAEDWEREEQETAAPNRFMIVRDEVADPVPSIIEDAAFEIENRLERKGDEDDFVVTDTDPDKLPTLEFAERTLIGKALERFDGNRRQTAQALGISERTLYRKIKEFEKQDA